MDHTKTKTFIAFINVSGKDRWWIDGNCTFESDRPTILPYDTEEQKKTALEVGKLKGMWDETTDVQGIILKVQGNPFEIINRKEADALVKERAEAEAIRKAELGISPVKQTGKKKKQSAKVETNIEKEVVPSTDGQLQSPVEHKQTVIKEKVIAKKEKDNTITKRPSKAKFQIEE